MLDTGTGQLLPLDPKFFVGAVPNTREYRERLQAACDEAQSDRSRQGPVFQLGEIVEIRGGRFQVTKIECDHLELKGLPAK